MVPSTANKNYSFTAGRSLLQIITKNRPVENVENSLLNLLLIYNYILETIVPFKLAPLKICAHNRRILNLNAKIINVLKSDLAIAHS